VAEARKEDRIETERRMPQGRIKMESRLAAEMAAEIERRVAEGRLEASSARGDVATSWRRRGNWSNSVQQVQWFVSTQNTRCQCRVTHT
jgi:hypothetical protein